MGSFTLVVFKLLVLVASCCSPHSHKGAASGAVHGQSPKHLLLQVVQTDSGIGGTNQFVYLRVFSDRSIEFHPKRNQELKRERTSRAQVSEQDLDATLTVLGRNDVVNLPSVFESTFTPKDFYWTLDFTIPRGAVSQQIRVVNFAPHMATQNNKTYPEALVRLVCAVWALRKDLRTETPDLTGDCQDFAA